MKPILFSTEMVRAILAGRKTQTRRVIKPQPYEQGVIAASEYRYDIQTGTFAFRSNDGYVADVIKSPIKTGDILWVRETWVKLYGDYFYRADGKEIQHQSLSGNIDYFGYSDGLRWKPSIHMPRKAARIFLRVTGVRAERLQDISPEDVQVESFQCVNDNVGSYEAERERAIFEFRELWDKLNAKRGYSWESNPWVWVYEFESTEVTDNE